MALFKMKIIPLCMCLVLTLASLLITSSLLASQAVSATYSIYHPNATLAWNGDPYSSFYHDNAQIAWHGPKHTDRCFYFRNKRTAWKGFLNKEASYSYDPCTVYHSNGNMAWRGAANKETSYSYDPCTIYHSNGNMAWRGATNKETSYSYDPCTLYHSNGNMAWRGATNTEVSYSYDPCTIYHANGAIAWRGCFAKDNSSEYACGVYYDNKQLAWSGKKGDPFYDKDGEIQASSVEAINLSLGDNSWLYISSAGDRILYLSIGEGSYLTFSNQDDNNPILAMSLESGYMLNFFPHTGETPQLHIYGNVFEINYQK